MTLLQESLDDELKRRSLLSNLMHFALFGLIAIGVVGLKAWVEAPNYTINDKGVIEKIQEK